MAAKTTSGMIYLGTVTNVSGAKVYVTIPELGGGDEFGPLNVVSPAPSSGSLTTGSANGPDPHTHSVTVATTVAGYYEKGDRVVVAQIGHVKEDLIVLGKLG